MNQFTQEETNSIRRLLATIGRAIQSLPGALQISQPVQRVVSGEVYSGGIFVPLGYDAAHPILTSRSFDGDLFSTTAKTLIDLSAEFGAPPNIKAVMVRAATTDTASATTLCYLGLSPNDTAGEFSLVSKPYGRPNGDIEHENGIVPCNTDGDIYYQTVASGVGTLGVRIQIHGYWI